MVEPFLGDIRLWPSPRIPEGWALCDGSLLQISENDALFVLLGTTYGGDGMSTFALPDLRGRVPIHIGPSNALGEQGGAESVTLMAQEVGAHTHELYGTAATGRTGDPTGAFLATSENDFKQYRDSGAATALGSQSLSATGGATPHENRQPSLAVNYVIALTGVFPPRD
ncbi:MAG: tail fiber protein [Patulibacter minatonensis]